MQVSLYSNQAVYTDDDNTVDIFVTENFQWRKKQDY